MKALLSRVSLCLRHHPRVASWLGFVALMAVFLPFNVWRATQEGTFWLDEAYTICKINGPWSRLTELTAGDQHPPLYFFALKGWMALAAMAGFSPGLFWARILNELFWAGMAAGVWILGGRMLGAAPGALVAWMIVGGASAGWAAGDMRSYGLALAAATVCFFLLLRLDDRRLAPSHETRSWRLWAAYAALAGAALWSHLLAGVVIGWLGVFWLALAVARRRGQKGFFLGGACAHALALLAFIPWLASIPNQMDTLGSSSKNWNTPPTVGNLARVFIEWFPLGQNGFNGRAMFWVLGIGSAVLPLGAAVLAATRRRSSDALGGLSGAPTGKHAPDCPNRGYAPAIFPTMACSAILIAVVNVLLLWGLNRYGRTPVFHGPRYTVFSATLWAAGLAGVILWAVSRRRWPFWIAWALAAPWLLCSLFGQWTHNAIDARWGLPRAVADEREMFPAPGETLYVMPGAAIPFLRSTLKPWRAIPAEQLFLTPPAGGNVAVFQVFLWDQVSAPADMLLGRAIDTDAFAESHESRVLAFYADKSKIHSLKGVLPDKARALAAQVRLPAPGATAPPSGASLALAIDQYSRDGWSKLELNDDPRLFRWASRPESIVRFGERVPPGEYILHFQLYRQPYPHEVEPMAFHFAGESDVYRVEQGPGVAEITIPVRLESAHDHPALHVEHGTWRPVEVTGGDDFRTLAYLFFQATLEPAR